MSETPSVARCVVRRGDELLVEERVDPESGDRVHVPLGQRVPADGDPETAVQQTFRDQLGVALADLSALGTFEDAHVFEGQIEAAWAYDESGFTVYDPETGETDRVCWLHVDDFRKYGETLEPAGLLEAL